LLTSKVGSDSTVTLASAPRNASFSRAISLLTALAYSSAGASFQKAQKPVKRFIFEPQRQQLASIESGESTTSEIPLW
jgi:hypothetical protein